MTSRRQFMQSIPTAGAAFAVAGHFVFAQSPARTQEQAPFKEHFHTKGKAPSKFTRRVLKRASTDWRSSEG